MKFLISLLMVLMMSSTHAQISEIGLIGYFPFDSNTMDESDFENDGIGVNITYGEDSQGNPESAAFFNGLNSYVNLSQFANIFREN